jgi:hypothetical protein
MCWKVDALPDDSNALIEQKLPLLVPHLLRHGAVRAHHPVPGHAGMDAGKRPADLTRRAQAEVFGDVTIGDHPPARDGRNERQHSFSGGRRGLDGRFASVGFTHSIFPSWLEFAPGLGIHKTGGCDRWLLPMRSAL